MIPKNATERYAVRNQEKLYNQFCKGVPVSLLAFYWQIRECFAEFLLEDYERNHKYGGPPIQTFPTSFAFAEIGEK